MSPARRRHRARSRGRMLAALVPTVALGGMAITAATPAQLHPAEKIRVVHSPRLVVDDMHLQPGACVVRWSVDSAPRPDPACTPGAIDPAVTQDTLGTTICREGGYTGSVRPPAADTGRWKARSRLAYGVPVSVAAEYDHFIPLSLGGANSTSNLWVEPGEQPNDKDTVEVILWRRVCAGTVTLADAQRAIVTDWTTALDSVSRGGR